MPEKIIKRDGRVVSFDQERIINAIFKAAKAVGGADRLLAANLSGEVVGILDERFAQKIPTVEDVQDTVEKVLIENGHAKTAKAYILYRRQHEELRDIRNLFLSAENMFNEYLGGQDWKIKENSNMNYSLQGLNNHVISTVTSKYWLEKIYPEEVKEAHLRGDLHIHDLGLLAPYCCGWDLFDLLMHGFAGVAQKVESAPPKHFRTALGQVVNFFFTLQGEAAGAQALANFDTYLAPFIHFDNLSFKEVKQAMQEFVFNINVPTRVGFQTPFVNITMDVTVSPVLADQPVLIGGKYRDQKYREFQKEMDMLNEAFCDVMMEGDARGRTFTFPIPTYNVTEDFHWESSVVEKIMQMTARYGIPYFANFINSDLSPEDVRSMCCRLRLDNRELRNRGGGLFGANPLTGSVGVVTLNMPRIGFLATSEEDFLERTRTLMEAARESLLLKKEVLEKMTNLGLYPYSRHYLRVVKERFGGYWHNHFNTIGLVGVNEAALNFLGVNIGTGEGQQFARKLLQFMRETLLRFQEETDQLFNLEATPAEGTAYRLAKLDKEMYPSIITAGQKEPYYTNSTQLPANFTDDLYEALTLQEPLQTFYTGGTVFHAYLGESLSDTASCKNLLKKMVGNSKIPYVTITPTFSVCMDHGYLTGEQPKCPRCGEETEVWSRVVGFYRPVQNWNKGKQEEYGERKTYAVR